MCCTHGSNEIKLSPVWTWPAAAICLCVCACVDWERSKETKLSEKQPQGCILFFFIQAVKVAVSVFSSGFVSGISTSENKWSSVEILVSVITAPSGLRHPRDCFMQSVQVNLLSDSWGEKVNLASLAGEEHCDSCRVRGEATKTVAHSLMLSYTNICLV